MVQYYNIFGRQVGSHYVSRPVFVVFALVDLEDATEALWPLLPSH
jgi:hypothetical protein